MCECVHSIFFSSVFARAMLLFHSIVICGSARQGEYVSKRTNNESNMQNSGNLNRGNHRATWQNQQQQHWPKCKDWRVNMQLHLHVDTCTFAVSSLALGLHSSILVLCFHSSHYYVIIVIIAHFVVVALLVVRVVWLFSTHSFVCMPFFLAPTLSHSPFFANTPKQNLFACLVVEYQFAHKWIA